MQDTSIFIPLVAMAFWTFAITFYMGRIRFQAVKDRKIELSYFKINHADETPEHMIRTAQHYNNLFEINGLFYTVVILIYLLQATSLLSILLAWAYFLSRAWHSVIHLGSNDVKNRFLAFLISLGFLFSLWLIALIGIF